MTMRIPAFAFVLSTFAASFAHATSPILQVAVLGPRIHVSDVVSGSTEDAGAIDLGPVPTAGGSRVIVRAEIVAALKEHGEVEPHAIPGSVRVVRKMTQLTAADIERTIREALTSSKMPRGATLAVVRAPRVLDLPDGYTSTTTELQKPPHRAGAFSTNVILSFFRDAEVLARVSVPIELSLSTDAASFDLVKGAPVTLVIRRGLVEVTAPATAAADADVGDAFPILLRPSGRVISARLTDKSHALSLEQP